MVIPIKWSMSKNIKRKIQIMFHKHNVQHIIGLNLAKNY